MTVSKHRMHFQVIAGRVAEAINFESRGAADKEVESNGNTIA